MHDHSILFLTNAYPDFESSYRGIFIKKLSSLLTKEGYFLSIVTPKVYKGSRLFEEQDGMKVSRFPFFARDKLLIEHKKIPYLRMILYYISGVLLTLYTVLKNRCYLIHVHWAIPTGLIGVVVSFLLRKPMIITIHGSDLRLALERPGFLRKLFLLVCRAAVHLNCVSGEQKKELERLGIHSEKISTMPMGIDTEFLEISRNRGVEWKKRSITILSNRNLLPIYNVSLLIRAVPIILKEEPETKFQIAGEGTERKALEKEVEHLNINSSVEFLGRVPHKEMPSLLAQADIYVSTSLHDGTSVSLLEAMGSGAFPVVTDIPANREWITNGENGFLVSGSEAESLANRIIDAIRNRELFRKSLEINRLIVERRVLWSVYLDRIKNIYKDVLNS